jgi:hypothetical protein
MSKCDCSIGTYDRGDLLHKSTYLEILRDISKLQRNLYKMGLRISVPLSAQQIADNRRGYITRYNYCPKCGAKHDWKQLVKEITP